MPSAKATPSVPRILAIGAGPAASSMHLPVLARLRDKGLISLAAICDVVTVRAFQAKRKFGCLEAGGEASALLVRADIDAVYLFAGAQLHYDLGLAALRAGKH